jgi:hypothetical protein
MIRSRAKLESSGNKDLVLDHSGLEKYLPIWTFPDFFLITF